MDSRQDDPVASPCVGLCALNPARVCAGCGRHIDEIVGWSTAGHDQRRNWRDAARQRLAIIAASSASPGS
ncbi:MAG: DUF1289 domain-containing protein [Polycyclovorans sp.]|nr:DUF1289 domain-containing protein [Gammaproteobacteria bacterium]MEC8848314.1 DUF1289 domain-containing protein [Pseudomonadota bacterium]